MNLFEVEKHYKYNFKRYLNVLYLKQVDQLDPGGIEDFL